MLRIDEPAPLGDFELLVLLALLRLGNGAYGAAIRREIQERTGRGLSVSAAYVTLQRLETKGLVCSYVGDPAARRGGRRRRHYLVHESGVRAVERAYRNIVAMAEGTAISASAIADR